MVVSVIPLVFSLSYIAQLKAGREGKRTSQVVAVARRAHAGDGLLGQVVDLGALARVVGGRAADLGRRIVQARLCAAGDLGDELLQAFGRGRSGEEGDSEGLELHFGMWMWMWLKDCFLPSTGDKSNDRQCCSL